MKLYHYFNDKNYPIYISENTALLTPHTFLLDNTMWEEKSIEYFFRNVLKDKQINIVDVGAQSGLYSLYAKYIPNANFFSFEPFSETYNLLNENIKLNGITNIKTYNIGLSNTSGKSVLNSCLSHNGLHTMGENPIRFNDSKKVNIVVETIDNLFYEKNIPVDFLKIDTEGWEYFILKGGEKTIKKYKPYIQLEWNEINMKQCNVDKDEFIKYIEYLNYEVKNFINEELFLSSKQ